MSVLRDWHFIRHYLEMVVAMFAGMLVLGVPARGGPAPARLEHRRAARRRPWAALLGMALMMTIPMVALMRWRGHGWRPCWEMSASMFLPTFAAIALMEAGVLAYMPAMMLEHAVMLPAMLGAMLLRPQEYSCHAHGSRDDAAAAVEVAA